MKEWVPKVSGNEKPLYQAIVRALESDIRAGRVVHGTRLTPQRELAEQLKISVGTVSRAYSEAERLGYVTAGVGRGTFVNCRVPKANEKAAIRAWNFALNSPPKTGEDELIRKHLVEIGQDARLGDFLDYLPHAGHPEHCAALAPVVGSVGLEVSARDIILTPGAQHGLDIALRLVCPEGAPIVTEAFSFAGLTAISSLGRHDLIGAMFDADGVVPDSLRDALTQSGAKVVYLTPTLQTPTGTVMSQSRRRDIASLLVELDVWLVEDDAYAFLPPKPVTPISAMIPERSFYVASFAKSLAPGLRLGALIPPKNLRERAVMAMRATGWMAAPLMAELVVRLVRSGDFQKQVEEKRRTAVERTKLARDILGELIAYTPETCGYHVWAIPPDSGQIMQILNQASANGITIAPAFAAQMNELAKPGLRLCLGSFESNTELAQALQATHRLLRSASDMSYV